MKIRYPRSQFAKLLGFTDTQLTAADKMPELKALGGGPDSYQPRHLSAYRRVLDRHPGREPLRRQLFLNFKGGTGKTSLSVAYAYRLAEMGHRVLLIDLDSQGHATQHLGLAGENLARTVFDTLVGGVPLEDVIVGTVLAEFDVLPANLGMTTIDISLMPMAGREYKLQRALAPVSDRYEFIVMDAPPSFGLLNLNALMASDDLLVPVLPDFLSFHGLKLLFETLGQLEDDLNHKLQRIRIVINQYNPTTRIAREAKDALESHYREFLSDTIVRQCTEFARASSDGLPINAYAPASKGARDIDALITEMISARPERAMERSA
ncbi:MAG TPA: ParA family protein [Gemmatimonadales bacterium]|nr:ParA family protein [Gemmatimonadales bacterium]